MFYMFLVYKHLFTLTYRVLLYLSLSDTSVMSVMHLLLVQEYTVLSVTTLISVLGVTELVTLLLGKYLSSHSNYSYGSHCNR